MAKEFAWSFSKLKNYDTCGKRYYEIDVAKNYKEEESEQLRWGNAVHKQMEIALLNGTPLPGEMQMFQKWVDRVRSRPGRLLVEQKFSVTRNFLPCAYFAPDCWYRGKGDAVVIDGNLGLVEDWKTGAVKPDSVQLMLMALCMFAMFKDLTHVVSEFIWLGEDEITSEVYTREGIIKDVLALLPRVDALEAAHKTLTFPPKPSGLCKKYCPVVSCPFHGKGSR